MARRNNAGRDLGTVNRMAWLYMYFTGNSFTAIFCKSIVKENQYMQT